MNALSKCLTIIIVLVLFAIIETNRSFATEASEPDSADSGDVATIIDSTFSASYVIETQHRLFPDFSQIDTVNASDTFFIGEEGYAAIVLLFNPHLGITQEGEALAMTDTLFNPAIRVQVVHEDSLLQESWGFYISEKPHYYRNELLGFVLKSFTVSERFIAPPMRLKESD